jgi:glutathione S-transferase
MTSFVAGDGATCDLTLYGARLHSRGPANSNDIRAGVQKMKLYGSLVSPYVARVVLVARAKGLSLEPTAPPGGGIKSPEYLALNPMGKMPTLEDDGVALAESTVCMEYVDESHPQNSLMPTDPMQRARARLLGRIVDLYVMAQGGVFFRNMNPAQRNEADVAKAREALHKALSDLQHFMGDGPYAIGSKLSHADCAVLPTLLMMQGIVAGFGVTNLYDGLPKLARWAQQMQSDPITGPFIKEYQAAMAAFLSGRRG